MNRTNENPVTSLIRSSLTFSRKTASAGDSPGRACLTYFSLPSNSQKTPNAGQAKSTAPTNTPYSSRTSYCNSGAGSPYFQHKK